MCRVCVQTPDLGYRQHPTSATEGRALEKGSMVVGLRGFQCPRDPCGLGAEIGPGPNLWKGLSLCFQSLLRKTQRLAVEMLA